MNINLDLQLERNEEEEGSFVIHPSEDAIQNEMKKVMKRGENS